MNFFYHSVSYTLPIAMVTRIFLYAQFLPMEQFKTSLQRLSMRDVKYLPECLKLVGEILQNHILLWSIKGILLGIYGELGL